ncbi:MAG: PilN domain-containing protein [Azonexus sp.]|jgi:MSHA biogenesis protein MshI|nr:PilN domain-containing protein [Azonexus sp.]
MKLSSRPSSTAVATAIRLAPDRIDVASVRNDKAGLPSVVRMESFPRHGDLANTLGRLRQGGKLNGPCALLLPPDDYQLLALDAPTLPDAAPEAEMREAMRWKIKDMVSFPVAAAGIDAQIIPPAQPGRPAQALAVAVDHAALRPLIEACQSAKVDLRQITTPEFAQHQIAALFARPDRAIAVLSFSDWNGLLTLSCNGILYTARRFDLRAADLAADPSLYDRVTLDVQRLLDNFDRNFNNLPLERLLVLPVPEADDFIPHLRGNLYQPVEALQIGGGLNIAATPLLANPATLADALPTLGAALGLGRGAVGVNLFDPALRHVNDPWTAKNLGLGLAASLLLCVAVGGWAHWRQSATETELQSQTTALQAAREESQKLTAEITGYKPNPDLQGQLDETQESLQMSRAVLDFLKTRTSAATSDPGTWLRGFARRIPDGLWLTGFDVDVDTGALNIRGRTLDPKLIAEYVRRLNTEPSFQGREFAALEVSESPPPTVNAGSPPGGAAHQEPTHFHEFTLTSAPGPGVRP